MNTTTQTAGINAADIAATATAVTTAVDSAEARRRRSDKMKAGAIGTAKAVGYMAVGVGLTIGVQKLQAKRQQEAQQ